jgi:hypothetical protein
VPVASKSRLTPHDGDDLQLLGRAEDIGADPGVAALSGLVPFPAAVATTIAMTVPTFSAVTRQFGGSCSGWPGAPIHVETPIPHRLTRRFRISPCESAGLSVMVMVKKSLVSG